jgi:hypothetical protein
MQSHLPLVEYENQIERSARIRPIEKLDAAWLDTRVLFAGEIG